MAMKSIKVKWHGVSPLLLHSNQGVNPLHPLTREKKLYTGKRKKTDEDVMKILDIDYLLGLYWDDNIGVYVPATNVEATVREGAKRFKRGKDVASGIMASPEVIKLDYDGPRTREELMENMNFRDVRVGRIGKNSITICRPRFNNWQIEFFIDYDPDIWNKDVLLDVMASAGKYVGFCDYRPRYGKFEVFVG